MTTDPNAPAATAAGAADHRHLKRGTKVRYDGRVNGEQEGTVYLRVIIPSYLRAAGGDDLIYYQLVGVDLLVPAEDITDIREKV